MTRIPGFILLCMSLIVALALPCAAQDEDITDDEAKPVFSADLQWSYEATTNFFNTGENAESNSVMKTNLDWSAEYHRGRDALLRLDFDITRNDDRKYASEDSLDSEFGFAWEQPLGRGRAGLSADFSQLDASNQSLTMLSSRSRALAFFYSHPLGDADTLRMEAFSEKEFYDDDSQDSRGHGWSAALNHDFGNLIYGSMEYGAVRTHYPGEAIVDISYNETPEHRSDRANTFTASVSRLVSLYPMAYVQVSYERVTNSSDSEGYYFWYNDATFEYGEKLIPGYDAYTETSLSLFAYREFNEKTSASVYYLSGKTRYPNRYTGNFGQYEPVTPTENKLTYAMIDVRHMMNESQTVFVSRTWVNSRSNDSLYEYKEQITSLGMINKF